MAPQETRPPKSSAGRPPPPPEQSPPAAPPAWVQILDKLRHKNATLLAISCILFLLWLAILAYLAFSS